MLKIEVGLRSERIRERRTERAERAEHLCSFIQIAAVAGRDPYHRSLGESRQADIGCEFVGRIAEIVMRGAQHFTRLRDREEDEAAIDLADRVEAILERCSDAEVARAAPHAPKQVAVLVRARSQAA